MRFPTTVYRGDWNPDRHDAVESRRVASETDLSSALDDGWRVTPDEAVTDTDDPSETPKKKRGRPPKVKDA